jgi:two-component system, sensor histidine kinase and response regulator
MLGYSDHENQQQIQKEILDIIPELAAFIDTDYRYQYVNMTYLNHYKSKEENILGHQIDEFLGKENFIKKLKPCIDKCLQAGETISCDYSCLLPDGENKTIQATYYPHYNKSGNIDGVIAHGRDITDEQQLKGNCIKIVNSIDEALIVINKNFIIEDINEQGLKLFNRPREDVIGKRCDGLINISDNPGKFYPNEKSIRSGRIEHTTFYDEQTNRWYSSKTLPIRGLNNEIMKYSSIIHDITGQISAEKKLRECEDKFKALVDNIGEGIGNTDKNEILVFVNPAAERIFGVEPGQLSGRSLKEFFSDKQYNIILQQTDKRKQGQTTTYEVKLKRPDGEKVPIMVTASPRYNVKGEHIGSYAIFHDISKIKQAEKSLKQNERRSKALLNAIPDMMFRMDKDGVYLDYKAVPSQMYTQGQIDIIGKKMQDITPEHFSKIAEYYIQKTLETSSIQIFEYELEIKGRGLRHFEARMVPSGKDEVIAIVRDITDEKKTELALLHERYLLKSLMDNIPVNIYFKNRKSQFTRINKALATLFGLKKPDDALGKTDFDFFTHEHASKAYNDEQNIIKTGEPLIGIEEKETWPDRDITWRMTTKMPLKDAYGEITGTFGISVDITARKQAEYALQEREELFKQLAENISEVFYVYDPEKKKTLYVSPAFEKMWEMPVKKVMDNILSCAERIHPDDIDDFMKAVRKESEDGKSLDIIFRIVLPNDQTKWIHSRNFPVYNEEGQAYRTVGFAEDITKTKLAEQEIREANVTKDKLFSIIGHDLKNPLGNIKGFTELLEKNYDKYSAEKIRKFISVINSSTHSLLNLVDNLLTWSRSQRHKIEINPQTIHIQNIVESCFDISHTTASKKQISLVNKIQEGLTAFADKQMITTVIRNLLSNAIKFTHEHGSVTVDARVKESVITISVIDTGIGMNKKKAHQIFESGKLNSSAGTQGETGSGLGLVICKEFVEQNNGNIWAKSTPGKGSTFCFTIPAKKPDIY